MKTYTCEFCDYTTQNKSNYNRHLKRKIGCGDKNNNPNAENYNQHSENYNQISKNDNLISENDNLISKNNSILYTILNHDEKVQCNQCNKCVKQKNINNHLKICKGVPINVCHFCNKTFKNKFSKNNHILKSCKNNQLYSHDNANNSTSTQNIFNGNIDNSMRHCYNTTNNKTHIQNQNVHINIAGKESDDLLNVLLEHNKEVIHGLMNQKLEDFMMELVRLRHFNSDFPENQNYIKENTRNSLIKYFAEGEQWEVVSCEKGINMMMDNLLDFFINKFLYKFLKNNTPQDKEERKEVIKIIKTHCNQITKSLGFSVNKLRDFLKTLENNMDTSNEKNKRKKKIMNIIQDILTYESQQDEQKSTTDILVKYKSDDEKEYSELQLEKINILKEFENWKQELMDDCPNAPTIVANNIFFKKWENISQAFFEKHNIKMSMVEI